LLLGLAPLNGWHKPEKASEKEALKSAALNFKGLRDTLQSKEGAVPVAVENLKNLDKDEARYCKAEFKRVWREFEVEREITGNEDDDGGEKLDEQKEETKTEKSEADDEY
jgi:hypothetical protein